MQQVGLESGEYTAQIAHSTRKAEGMAPPLVMGILNVTPDSFSDGGEYGETEAAVQHARDLTGAGADLIDIGGESTRPGAQPVSPPQEQRRILPVVEQLLELPLRLSVDTRHPGTARAALQLAQDRVQGQADGRAQELIINDVSGLLTDPAMPQVVAEFGCEVVITHNRGDARTMQARAQYQDLLAEVVGELLEIRGLYLDAGVPPERIILDPGIGFAKTHAQNWQLIRNLDRFTGLGHRVLFGASRKGFLGSLLADSQGEPRPADQRDAATAALSLLAAQAGCWAVRVHEPQLSADAFRVHQALWAAPAVG